MKKAIIFLLILASGCGWEAFSQTMVLRMNVQRIPVTGAPGKHCENQRVIFSEGKRTRILTPDDTLQLKRVKNLVSEPGHSIAIYLDELHDNHPYNVRYLKGSKGIILYISPYVTLRDSVRQDLWNVRIEPTPKRLYVLVLKTLPCN